MRYFAALVLLLLTGCGDDGLTRNFSLLRDSAPDTMASTQLPLSAPPSLTMRPSRPVIVGSASTNAPSPDQNAGSVGQDALVQAAGPAAEANIRTVISENSGLVYPDAGFVERLMDWTPPAGYTPVITGTNRSGGWFGRIF